MMPASQSAGHLVEALANIALRAARLAAAHIIKAYDRPDLIRVNLKSTNNYVTNVDREAQRIITEAISRTYPEHGFLGEEDDPRIDQANENSSAPLWIIDPIDGTTNFSRQIPHFCVSIACSIKGKIEHGVIINPITNEEYVASRGKGAQLNGRKIRVSQREQLTGSVFGIAGRFPSGPVRDGHENICDAIDAAEGNLREQGSAALDLANLAAGRIDGLWMRHVNLWDYAAGSLLVQEAGGLAGDFEGGVQHLKKGDLVAGNPKIFRLLMPLVREHLGDLE
jgi:myo-inositol-1(or 4)-monophosphatase